MVRHPWPTPSAHAAPVPATGPQGAVPRLLAELLALNEEMVSQLGREGPNAAAPDPFVASLIEQHAASAAQLREHLVRTGSTVAGPAKQIP
jgi:hypothetical protein